ncbi:MAG: hypothetical protein ACRDRK_14300 [Pseudonocardia sp.]
MKLRRLCKSASSTDEEDCSAIYLTEELATMVAQGAHLDADTAAQLRNVAADETGIALPTETVLRAAALFLAEQGRPAMLTEVKTFLAEAGVAS